MTLFDVSDLDEILTVNPMRQKNVFESWAKVSAALVWKL